MVFQDEALISIRSKNFRSNLVLWTLFVLLVSTSACSNDKPDFVKSFKDRSLVPAMYTDSVTTLISDSGKIRYRVLSEVWKVYDKMADPRWYFPKKVYFERFDDSLRTESLVQSDTATYFTQRKLWELRKNVKLINRKGEKFETSLLYWDQRSRRIYSDSFIRIEKVDQILTGYGFESNEQLTQYRIFKQTNEFPLDQETAP